MPPILVDNRVGSKHLATIIRNQDERAEVELVQLEYGDVALTANGPDDEPLLIGIEVKKIEDLLNSIATGRFIAHQLPGLLSMYDVCFLLVQGVWRRDSESGALQALKTTRDNKPRWTAISSGSRRWMWRDVEMFLISIYIQTMMLGTPVGLLQTGSSYETASLIISLNSWGDKRWKEHRSLKAISQVNNNQLVNKKQKLESGVGRLMPPSLLAKIAAQFDCIGATRAITVANHFNSVQEFINADADELQAVDGIGKLTARRVVDAIHGR